METRVTRFYETELRAENNEKHGNYIEGLPIVFNSATDLGWYEETIDAHALDNTDLKDVRFLVNHNTDMIPLARSRNNNENSTMQMSVTEEGLRIRADLDTENNTDARSLYSAIQRHDLSSMSFMFSIDDDEWENLDSDYPKRTIKSIKKVYEVSAVTFPAYQDTELYTSQRNKDKEALDNARLVLESARSEQRSVEINNIREIIKEILN